jgi:polysaccharide biosynthesis transport protein
MNDINPVHMFSPVDQHRLVQPDSSAEETSVVSRILLIAVRRRKIIIAAMAASLLIGILITFLMTPVYRASSTIEIARESNNIVQIQQVQRESSEADLEFYQTQYGLLQSRVLAEKVAVQLKLVDDPSFFEMYGAKVEQSPPVGANGRFPADGRDARTRTAGTVLLKKVSVSPVRLSRLVTISFTSPDPVLAAKVVNNWTTSFMNSTLERRFEATAYARKFLEDRLVSLRERLENSERQLVNYASDQRIINLPGASTNASGAGGERSIIAENLATLNGELTQAKADRIKAEARVRSGSGGAVTEALQNTAINGLRAKRAELSAEYQKLMVQFEPDYPAARALKSQIDQLDRAIGTEERRVSASFGNTYRDSALREKALSSQVEGLKGSLLDLRRRSIQYNIFQREVDTNRQLYDALLQRYKEIGVAGGVGVNNISIVDPADTPRKPSSPRLIVNMILATLAGLALSGMIIFLLEQTDDAVDDPADVERRLNIPLLGSIPKVSQESAADALKDRKSPLVEAYISVQTNLRFATKHGIPHSIAVTSTRSGEGKSTTSLALAVLLSRSGKRVVIVDGDMRSPSVHGLLGLDNKHGLSDYLAGADDYKRLLKPVTALGFVAMTAGSLPPNAAELLTGDRLAVLITALGAEFDHVIIDSPPVVGLADAPLIGSQVEGVVFAIQSHGIRTSLVKVALARLESANTRVIGGILTHFESSRSSLAYGYDYGYGYGHPDPVKA